MNVLGIMCTWNNLEFLKCSVEQAAKFCDELIIVEGCHSKHYPKNSTDGTVEYLNDVVLKTYDNVKMMSWDYSGRYDEVQCKIRDKMPKQSKLWQVGNWIIQWDDDIFFFDNDLKSIRAVMGCAKQDTLKFKERRFTYNFKVNTFTNDLAAYHFDRITDGCYLQPVSKIFYKNGDPYNKVAYLQDIVYYHYPYVKLKDRVKARFVMSVEKGTPDNKRYKKWMSVDLKNINAYKNIIEEVNGETGLNVYDGKHPEILDKHKWRNIEDCRVL